MRVPLSREAWPEELEALVMRGLSFAPNERFASAREFADELRAVLL